MRKDILKIGLCLVSFLTLISCGESKSMEVSIVEPSMSDNYRSYYQIFVGSFADSDGDMVGDLKGIEDKLDYIVDMGYRGIWLSPIFESPSYHKYNTTDYFKIDDELGTMDDLKSLVSKAHEKNVKVILDLALNHSSKSCELYKKSVAAKAKLLGELRDGESELLDGMSDEEIESYSNLYSFSSTDRVAGSAAFRRVTNHSFYVESTFSDDMPEFNFDSALAWDTFYSIIDYYMLDVDVDGFRLDAVKYYYLGKNQQNYEALDKINDRVKADDPNGYLVCENWSDATTIEGYYENTDVDSYFYFPGNGSNGFINECVATFGARSGFYKGELAMVEGSHGHIPAPFMSNHDTGRLAKGELSVAKFVNGCFSTLTGNTFTYYGDEIGMSQGGTNDESKRTHMYWGDSYDCKDVANSSPATYLFGSVSEQLADESSLVYYVRRAMNMRMAIPAIGHGTITGSSDVYDETNMLLSIDKKYGDDEIRIVYNFDSKNESYYEDDEYVTKIGELTIDDTSIRQKGNKFVMKPYSILFLEK